MRRLQHGINLAVSNFVWCHTLKMSKHSDEFAMRSEVFGSVNARTKEKPLPRGDTRKSYIQPVSCIAEMAHIQGLDCLTLKFVDRCCMVGEESELVEFDWRPEPDFW